MIRLSCHNQRWAVFLLRVFEIRISITFESFLFHRPEIQSNLICIKILFRDLYLKQMCSSSPCIEIRSLMALWRDECQKHLQVCWVLILMNSACETRPIIIPIFTFWSFRRHSYPYRLTVSAFN
jgi:hypothetical protein